MNNRQRPLKTENKKPKTAWPLFSLFGFSFQAAFFLSLFMIHNSLIFASPLSRLERLLAEDIADQRLNDFSKIEAAFILSGVQTLDSLRYYTEWYAHLLQKIADYPFDKFDRVAAASQVFNYLHTTWLNKYDLESTDLLDIVHHKKFNCVAATLLYNFLCEDLGWTTAAFETNTHVYTLFHNFSQPVMVENTSPRGFNIIQNLDAYSQLLLQYYPEETANRIGIDRLWAYENSKGREIDNTELLGLLAYNQAYFAKKRGDFERAYSLVLLAQGFNADSRSNIHFEKALTHQWGRQLYQARQFSRAFTVFADAHYRYPDVTDYVQNTRAAFFKSQYEFFQKRTWEPALQMIYEIIDLGLLTHEDKRQLSALLEGWRQGFLSGDQEIALQKADALVNILAN